MVGAGKICKLKQVRVKIDHFLYGVEWVTFCPFKKIKDNEEIAKWLGQVKFAS